MIKQGTKLKAIIVDDEYPARLMIKSLATNHDDVLTIIGEAKTGSEAILLIDQMLPDLIFLDINMPAMNGFQMLTKLKHTPYVIFTTAYDEFALKAFETNSIDYLLKPIEESRFAKSIEKVRKIHSQESKLSDLVSIQQLFTALKQESKPTAAAIKIGDKFKLIPFDDIVYIEAKDKYVFLVTKENKEYLSDTRLAEYEAVLPSNFLRVQKSFIINKDKISEIQKYFGNRLIISMNNRSKTRITTGVTYINQIRKSLGL
jgi:two-component system LytT family response regulator